MARGRSVADDDEYESFDGRVFLSVGRGRLDLPVLQAFAAFFLWPALILLYREEAWKCEAESFS